MQNIVYVAHSKERDLRRARFSILNLQYFAAEIEMKHRIIVYTDLPAYFTDLDVVIEEMDHITISMWQGTHHSAERVRIMAARDAFATYHGDVILVKNEVFYLDSPGALLLELSEDCSLMYEEVAPLASIVAYLPETITYTTTEPYQKSIEKALSAPLPNTPIYNTAVIGINESDRATIKKVLYYFDALLAYMPEHQAAAVAYSHVLGTNTFLQEANDWVDVYDGDCKLVDPMLHSYFRENNDLPLEVQPTEAWRFAHQLDGSLKFSEMDILSLVREINH